MKSVKQLRILELFSGTESFSKIARERGHKTFTVDIDKSFNPDLCINILNFDISKLPEEFRKPDVIWASPPCTTFSCASLGYHWNNHKPKTEEAKVGIEIIKKTLKIIEELKPKYYVIENPMGMLRVQDFMLKYPRQTVTYCQYGDTRMKPTDIWTNLNWVGKRCKYKSSCHLRTPRGSKTGTQGLKDAKARAVIPKDLCLDVIISCENALNKENPEFDWKFDVNKKYNVIYADPPWKYATDVSKHYNVVSFSDINNFPINKIASDNCALFLWSIYPILPECIETLKKWGFRYVTVAFTWVKTNKNNGKPFFGMGNWTRANAEVCLLGLKGNLKRKSNKVAQVVMSPLREHSRKPDEIRDKIVELVGDLPRIELFARQKTKGWDVWGNETDKFKEVSK